MPSISPVLPLIFPCLLSLLFCPSSFHAFCLSCSAPHISMPSVSPVLPLIFPCLLSLLFCLSHFHAFCLSCSALSSFHAFCLSRSAPHLSMPSVSPVLHFTFPCLLSLLFCISPFHAFYLSCSAFHLSMPSISPVLHPSFHAFCLSRSALHPPVSSGLLLTFPVLLPVLCLAVFFPSFPLNFLSNTFTIYIYILNFRDTNSYYHHFCMHDTPLYHHQLPVETKGSGSSPLPLHKVPLETKGLSAIRTIILRARDRKISCPGNPPR